MTCCGRAGAPHQSGWTPTYQQGRLPVCAGPNRSGNGPKLFGPCGIYAGTMKIRRSPPILSTPGKCVPELQTVLVAGTCPLRLPGYHGGQVKGFTGPKHHRQPPPTGPHAGTGAEIPSSSLHVQSTLPHGSPLVRTMGPGSYCNHKAINGHTQQRRTKKN